jgi:hypothetical protein
MQAKKSINEKKRLRKLKKQIVMLIGLLIGSSSLGFAAVDCYITPWGAPPWTTPDIWADNDGNGIQEDNEPVVWVIQTTGYMPEFTTSVVRLPMCK